jgi:hypothetical protein
MKETTYYYIKYWETLGILAVKTEFEPGESGYIHVRGDYKDKPSYLMCFNRDAFLTLEEARAGITIKKATAIKAAEKKLDRLKAIDPSTLTVTVEKY